MVLSTLVTDSEAEKPESKNIIPIKVLAGEIIFISENVVLGQYIS